MLRDFGLTDFELELSMKDDEKEKWIGSEEFWESSTQALRRVALASGLKLTEVPGEAAFYGPKIALKTTDAIGRVWQLSTVQVDFEPARAVRAGVHGQGRHKKRPIMIHRALFGSIERFFAILLEHYAGDFPVWLSPVQVVGIPVAEEYADYLDDVIAALRAVGVRAEVDHSDERMQKKIRNHTTGKMPLILIAGEQDRAAGTVSFRFRDGIPGERRAARRGGRADPPRDRGPRAGLVRRRPAGGGRVRVTATGGAGTGEESVLEDAAHLAGVPDEFQRLWVPHRMAYIQAGPEPLREECPFCDAPKHSDEERLIVARGTHAYVLLNLFPYNSGHLLVCPYRHVATYDQATAEEVAEIGDLTQTAMRVLARRLALRRLQHRHEPGRRRGRGRRRPPAPARRAAVEQRRELLPDHREDQGAAAAARRRAQHGRRGLARLRRDPWGRTLPGRTGSLRTLSGPG